MDICSHTDFGAFLDFCKSLDERTVRNPEHAVQLYRSRKENGVGAESSNNLGRDLLRLHEQIVASGTPLLGEEELEQKKATYGDPIGAEIVGA